MALPAAGELFKTTFDESLQKLVQPAGIVPGLVLVGLDLVVLYPHLLAENVPAAVTFSKLDATWQLGVTAISALVLGYVILAFSPSVLRVATGEAWRASWLRPLLVWVQRQRRESLRNRPADPGAEARARAFELQRRYPRLDELAPTAFGNQLAAISDGIVLSTGADLTATWTQMREAVRAGSPDFLKEIDENQVGFMSLLNLTGVFVIFAAQALALGLLYPGNTLLGSALLAFGAAFLSYRGAVARLASWGDLVAAGYDLYRPKLRELLGIGTSVTAAYEVQQMAAVSRSLLWDAADRSFAADEPALQRLVASSTLTATTLDRQAYGPMLRTWPRAAASEWVYEYTIEIRVSDKDAAGPINGFVEVFDRQVPRRIPDGALSVLEPPAGAANPTVTASVVRRSDVGLLDAVRWKVEGLPKGGVVLVRYRLGWNVSLSARPNVPVSAVRLVEGVEDIRGSGGRIGAELEVDESARVRLSLLDDRVAGSPKIRARYRAADGPTVRLSAVASGPGWTISGDLPAGKGTLQVFPSDE